MLRILPALAALALLAACGYHTIPPSESPVSQDEVLITGVGVIDGATEYPIRSDQIYPQVRIRAYERALNDARGQVLGRLSAQEVNGITFGDIMAQHRTVEILAEEWAASLHTEPARYLWDEGLVEVDIRLQAGDVQSFISTVPYGFVVTTEPGQGWTTAAVPRAVSAEGHGLPLPESEPTSMPASQSVSAFTTLSTE